MGTNKRYAESIDQRAVQRAGQRADHGALDRASERTVPPSDSRARLRTEAPPESPPVRPVQQPVQQGERMPQPPLRDWQTPWPPIRIAELEWVIMRESRTEPAAIVRIVRMGPRNETFYRVVTWAVASESRSLVGYYTTLDQADRAVLFSPPLTVTPR